LVWGIGLGPEQAASVLARTSLFEGLDDSARLRLAAAAVTRTYKRGQLIFAEGDVGEALFVILEGQVKVFVTSEEGVEMVLVTLGKSDSFGELSLIDGAPRSASAEALEATKILGLGRRALLDLLPGDPRLTEALLRSLGSLVRRLTEQAADLVFLDLHGRVAKLLLALADRDGHQEGGKTVLDLHVTQTDLAGMVGGSRQSVNQILHAFERRGYVELQGRTVVLNEVELLRRRAGVS
jgi:CRP/FNR family cyclic AMP-dependent transcriptional regulator